MFGNSRSCQLFQAWVCFTWCRWVPQLCLTVSLLDLQVLEIRWSWTARDLVPLNGKCQMEGHCTFYRKVNHHEARSRSDIKKNLSTNIKSWSLSTIPHQKRCPFVLLFSYSPQCLIHHRFFLNGPSHLRQFLLRQNMIWQCNYQDTVLRWTASE